MDDSVVGRCAHCYRPFLSPTKLPFCLVCINYYAAAYLAETFGNPPPVDPLDLTDQEYKEIQNV